MSNEQTGFTCKTAVLIGHAKRFVTGRNRLHWSHWSHWSRSVSHGFGIHGPSPAGAQKAHPSWSCRRWSLASLGDRSNLTAPMSKTGMWTNKIAGAIIWKDLDNYQPKWFKHTWDRCETFVFQWLPVAGCNPLFVVTAWFRCFIGPTYMGNMNQYIKWHMSQP